MEQREIKTWLQYWRSAGMVAVDSIRAHDQVWEARKYCECMRKGKFSPDLVSDLEIWRALTSLRSDEEKEAQS